MKLKTVLVLLLVVCAVSVGYAQNLLPNPGFEQGSETDPADWTKYNDCGREGWAAETGAYGMALYGWLSGRWGGVYTGVDVDLANGSKFTLSFDVLCESNFRSSGNELWIKLEFFSGDSEIYEVEKSIYTSAIGDAENWNTYTLIHTNTDATIDLVKAVVGGGGFAPVGDGKQAVKIDNASLTQSKHAASLTITNPASESTSVPNETSSCKVQGTSELAIGTMLWTNALTGASGSLSAADVWSIDSVALAVGANQISVTASNTDVATTRSVTITRHALAPSVAIVEPAATTNVDALVSTFLVSGTCNSETVGVNWDNGRGDSGPATIYGGVTWTTTVALAFGDNNVVITGTNTTGEIVQDTVLIVRASDPPSIDILYPSGDIIVASSVSSMTFTGECYDGASGNVVWTNALAGVAGSFPVAARWTVEDIALGVGYNVVTMLSSNVAGETDTASVTVTRLAGDPVINISDPATDINVSNTVSSYKVKGTVNSNVQGLITIENMKTGEIRYKTAYTEVGWSFENIVLDEGANFITVSGTNATGQVGSDSVTIYRDYPKGNVWINEMHYVNVGPTDENEGFEIAGEAGAVLDQYTLYLYGSHGKIYNTKTLSGVIGNEDTNSSYGYGALWFDYGTDVISNGPNCAVALTFKEELMEFISWRGVVTGVEGPADGKTSTDIGVTEMGNTPLLQSLQLQGFGLYKTNFVWGGPYMNSYSNLNYGQIISLDSDTNGIPDAWQDRYFGSGVIVDPDDDEDDDGYSNMEEFDADTNPIRPESFPQFVWIDGSMGTTTVAFASSRNRSYIVQVSTNLTLPDVWIDVEPAFMGITTGAYSYVSYPALTNQPPAYKGSFRFSATMPGTE